MIRSRTTCICFISPHKATDVSNWSGTLNSLYRALEAENPEIEVIGLDGGWLSILAKQFNRILYRFDFVFDCRMTRLYAICVGILMSCQLLMKPYGPIVAVAASNCVPFLITRRRIVYISDATFRTAAKIYPEMRTLPDWLSKQCDRNEKNTLTKADFVILPSKWASNSAKNDYGVSPEKIFELPFGANIDRQLIDKYFTPKTIDNGIVRFLFASADWERKGGDKAIEICRAIRESGIRAHLTILGRAPAYASEIDFVECKGFLRKSRPDELAEICREYQAAHFLVLPTLADASPIVFAEAQAFGVPPITHDVGGTGSSIIDGETGMLLSLDSSPEDFHNKLLPFLQNQTLYETLSQTSRRWFVEKAQWSRWSKLIFELCHLPPS